MRHQIGSFFVFEFVFIFVTCEEGIEERIGLHFISAESGSTMGMCPQIFCLTSLSPMVIEEKAKKVENEVENEIENETGGAF